MSNSSICTKFILAFSLVLGFSFSNPSFALGPKAVALKTIKILDASTNLSYATYAPYAAQAKNLISAGKYLDPSYYLGENIVNACSHVGSAMLAQLNTIPCTFVQELFELNSLSKAIGNLNYVKIVLLLSAITNKDAYNSFLYISEIGLSYLAIEYAPGNIQLILLPAISCMPLIIQNKNLIQTCASKTYYGLGAAYDFARKTYKNLQDFSEYALENHIVF